MLLERNVRDHDGLLERLEQALETGEITPREVESLLAHGQHPGGDRPTASGVLYTLGAVGVFSGLAIAYGTVFGDLPRAVRMARRTSSRWSPWGRASGSRIAGSRGGRATSPGWSGTRRWPAPSPHRGRPPGG